MKGLNKPPFKKISLTLVQISLIAGTLSLGIQASCKKGLSSCKSNSQQVRTYSAESPIRDLSPAMEPQLKVPQFIGFEMPAEAYYKLSQLDSHLSRYSGLSPPNAC